MKKRQTDRESNRQRKKQTKKEIDRFHFKNYYNNNEKAF